MSTAKKSVAALLAALLVLSGIAAASGAFGGLFGGDETSSEETTDEAAATEPDLEGIPDVVATVNGDEITREEFVTAYENQFQQRQIQNQMSGEAVDQDALKTETAEGLVSNELLLQEAERRDITASDEQVDESLEEFAETSGVGSVEDYLGTLAEQGLDEDAVRGQLADQVLLDQLFAEEGANDEPTEEELRELYDQAVAQQEQAPQGEVQELPEFDDVRPQLEEQLRTQQENEVAQRLIGELREDADVEINL